jgi:hypothetical protein
MENSAEEAKLTQEGKPPAPVRGTRSSIPRDDKNLVPWGENFFPWLAVNRLKANLDADRAALMRAHFNTYTAAMKKLEGGKKSTLLVAEKNAAKAIVTADIQGLIEFELRNPVFTEANLLEAGIRAVKTAYEHNKQITIHPNPDLDSNEINEVEVKIYPEGAAVCRIPRELDCRELEWAAAILDSAGSVIPEAKDCPLYGRGSRARFSIRVGPGHSGKRLILYARYTNHFPNPGPWSGPKGVTIK